MAEVGSAWVSVAPDAKGFGTDLNRQVSGEVSSAGKGVGSKFGSMLKLGLLAGVAGAGVAAVSFLKGSIDEAREAQKVGALTASTIKATGGAANVTAKQIGDLSGALSQKAGIDDEAIQSGANMLLTFKNLRNETGKGNDVFNQATSTLVDMGAALGKDPKSSAVALGKALNDPIKGIAALSRVGVTFNEQQKETITRMQESGDTMGAQKIILKELNSEFGGAAAAQATAGDKAGVAWGNFQETVGTALLPALDKLLNLFTRVVLYLTANVGPAFATLKTFLAPVGDAIQTVIDALSASTGGGGGFLDTMKQVGTVIAANVLPVLQKASAFFINDLLPAVTSVASYLMANLVPIFRSIWTIVSTQLLPIISSLAQFFYGTLLPAVMQIYSSIAKSLKPVFDQLFKTIKESILPSVQQLLAKFREWQPTIQKVVMILVKVIGFLLKLAAKILGVVLPPLIRLAGFLIKTLFKAIVVVIGIIVKIISFLIKVGAAFGDAGKAVGEFAGKVKDKIEDAIGFIRDLPGKIKSAVAGFGKLLYDAGASLIQGLIDGITSKVTALTDKIGSVAGKVKDLWPGSPVKAGPLTAWNRKSPGATLVERIAEGITSGPVDSAMARLASRVQFNPALGMPAAAGAGGGQLGGATRLRLVVDGREFNAYVDARADERVSSAQDLSAERGRARWSS